MSRLAILIEASRLKGHADLPGARSDVVNYTQFLTSPYGGAWKTSEIHQLSHPSHAMLAKVLTVASQVDFAIVTFSGHGHHVKGSDLDETRVCINDNEEVPVHTLYPGNPRALIISDACRNVTVLEEQKKAFQFSLAERKAQVRPDSVHCRDLYDTLVARAEKGPSFLYSCDLNESAQETASGGYFTRFHIEGSMEWATQQRTSASLHVNDSFEMAARATTARNPQQHPKQQLGRRMKYFPFAVFAP